MEDPSNNINAFKYPGMLYLFALGIIFFFLLAGLPHEAVFSVEIKADKPDTSKVYFDTGGGLSESNTATASLHAEGDFERIDFTIPSDGLKSLRFDPLSKPGSFLIRSMNINSGKSKLPISLEKLIASEKIIKKEMRDGLLYVETAQDDHDPQLMIPIPTPLPKPDMNFSLGMKPSIIYAGLITIAFLFLIVL
jgi:hypothetical protein